MIHGGMALDHGLLSMVCVYSRGQHWGRGCTTVGLLEGEGQRGLGDCLATPCTIPLYFPALKQPLDISIAVVL